MVIIPNMDIADIVAAIDAEIDPLSHAKALLMSPSHTRARQSLSSSTGSQASLRQVNNGNPRSDCGRLKSHVGAAITVRPYRKGFPVLGVRLGLCGPSLLHLGLFLRTGACGCF
jgi:hypothetical protein